MADPTPQTDGTKQLREPGEWDRYLARLASTLPRVSGLHGWVDEHTAAQLGLVQVLSAVRWRSVDLVALLGGRVEASRELEMTEVYLDFPDADATDPETPFAVVAESAETTYAAYTALTSVDVLEETLHVYGHNTILHRHGRAVVELQVQCLCGHKDDRAGLRKRLVEVLASEPDSDRAARRVSLPFYFDRFCRYTLQGVSYPDDGELAQAGRWPLVIRVRAEVEHVTLVDAPPAMRVPDPAVVVDEAGA